VIVALSLLQHLNEHPLLSLGTMCSGTDVCALAAHALCRGASKRIKKQVVLEHRFSCDLNKAKQRFIAAFSGPDHIFNNVTQLGSGRARDALTDSMRTVPSTDVAIAGFVCKDVSHMNSRSHQARACVSSSSLRTGSTLRGVFEYCENARPRIVILENVTAIAIEDPSTGISNGEVVVRMFRSLGCSRRNSCGTAFLTFHPEGGKHKEKIRTETWID